MIIKYIFSCILFYKNKTQQYSIYTKELGRQIHQRVPDIQLFFLRKLTFFKCLNLFQTMKVKE